MKLNNFLNLLDKLEIVINKSQGHDNSFKIYNIKYSKDRILLYRIKDITQHSNDYSHISTSMSIDILFEQTVNDSFFIGFSKFIKECSRFSGQRTKIEEITEEFRKIVEMEDVLQSI
jgi:hypothetical protein